MKFDKKEAAGQPLLFSAPKNPQRVMLAALLLSYAVGYEYVDRCLGFGVASEYSAWRAGVLVFVALYTVVVELAAWAGDRRLLRTTGRAPGRSWRGTARLFIMCWPAMIYWRLAAPAALCCWMAWRACLPSHSATFCFVSSCCGRHCTAGGPIMRDAKAARWKPPSV